MMIDRRKSEIETEPETSAAFFTTKTVDYPQGMILNLVLRKWRIIANTLLLIYLMEYGPFSELDSCSFCQEFVGLL